MTVIFTKEYVLGKWLRYNGLPADDETSAGFTDLSRIKEEALEEIEERYLSLLATAPSEYLPRENVRSKCKVEKIPHRGWRLTLPSGAGRPVSITSRSGATEIMEFHPLEGPLSPSLTIGVTGTPRTPRAYYSPKGIIEVYGLPTEEAPEEVYAIARPADGSYNLAPHLLPKLYRHDNEN